MYIFNPEHDMCLANGSPHYVPPASAMEFGSDCASITKIMEGLELNGGTGNLHNKIIPWGWNSVLIKQLKSLGYPDKFMPSEEDIALIRRLSGRELSVQALEHLYEDLPSGFISVDIPIIAKSQGSVIKAVDMVGRAVLKAPLSGSGKGLRWVDERLSGSDAGWCRNVIEKQGYVVVEPRYNLLLNCAMLFRCDKSIDFVGYSLFDTINGAYHSNVLASDEFIESQISMLIGSDRLVAVRDSLLSFLGEQFLGRYVGYLGVDQFVYKRGEDFFLNPVVEINVRMTMGLLARNLYDNHLRSIIGDGYNGGKYRMSVEFRKRSGVLLGEFGAERCGHEPFPIPLTAIDADTKYSVIVAPDQIGGSGERNCQHIL